jgi:8-amino-7-oxononanoate synthase
VAPLNEYATILESYDGRMVVDEAHSFGVLGVGGRGAAEYHGVESVVVKATTLSKAFCAQGAIVPCYRDVAEKLRRLPPLRGANAGSPISAVVSAAALRYMRMHPKRRTRLAELTEYLRGKLRAIGTEVATSAAPIFAFRIGDRAAMQSAQKKLAERGMYVLVSNYIGSGAEGFLRCAVFADHSEADLGALTEALAAL